MRKDSPLAGQTYKGYTNFQDLSDRLDDEATAALLAKTPEKHMKKEPTF